jgi:hypothetical protein
MGAAAAGTQFAADDTEKSIFATLFDGNKWMIFYNTVTKVLHWDFVRPVYTTTFSYNPLI